MAKRKESDRDELLRAAVSGRRSTLYRWMDAHHDEFAAILAEAGRPNWQALAEALAGRGLRNLRGEVSTGEGTRKTWLMVRQAVAARRRKPTRKLPPTVAPERQLAAKPAEQTEVASHADEQLARLDALFEQTKPKMPRPL